MVHNNQVFRINFDVYSSEFWTTAEHQHVTAYVGQGSHSNSAEGEKLTRLPQKIAQFCELLTRRRLLILWNADLHKFFIILAFL